MDAGSRINIQLQMQTILNNGIPHSCRTSHVENALHWPTGTLRDTGI